MKVRFLIGKFVQFAFTFGAVIAIAGCSTARPRDRPAEGYDAVRFRETVVVSDNSINEYQFLAGTMLVADRTMDGEGPIFCGIVLLNTQPTMACVGYDGNTLVIGPGGGFKRVLRPLSPSALERTKF